MEMDHGRSRWLQGFIGVRGRNIWSLVVPVDIQRQRAIFNWQRRQQEGDNY